MKITLPYTFTEMVIPKRCRKPRPERKQAEITLHIREITSAEAPVAIRHHGNDHLVPIITEYRWWKRQLWTRSILQRVSSGPQLPQTAEQFSTDPYPYQLDRPYVSYCYSATRPQLRKNLLSWARETIFVDGERWEKASEPRYVVMTFGLGCNHGLGWGTSLCTDSYYNSNISKDRYFRIDQFETAVAAATRIAANRGDTKALPIIETQRPDTFDVLIPEAVRLRPAKEHGNGDPFINSCEALIEGVKDPVVAGFGLMALLAR